MTSGEALLRVILERPDDDTARLVYADWLQENGRERDAAAIRWQIESGVAYTFNARNRRWESLTRPPSPPSGEFFSYLNRFLSESYLWGGIRVERGFVSKVTLVDREFISGAKELFAEHPVEQVWLNYKTPSHNISNGLYEWHCPLNTQGGFFSSLPVEIFSRLNAQELLIDDGYHIVRCKRYATSDAACYDQSRACVDIGRELARLPPLQASTTWVSAGENDRRSSTNLGGIS